MFVMHGTIYNYYRTFIKCLNVVPLLQEKQVEALESEYEQSQSDLKLAFRRITDLQNVIEDQIGGSDEEIR